MAGEKDKSYVPSITKSELKFMDLFGKEIANPKKAIHEMNRRFDRRKINYQAIQETTKVGIVELWGLRPTQEDRVDAGLLPGFLELAESDRSKVLENTVLILQDIVTQLNLGHQGSTLCSTVINKNEVYTTNLGDSTAFLCLVNQQGNVTLELLNTRHNPTEPSEAKRLKNSNKLVIHNRIAGMLAVSRALGDNTYEQNGLIHLPEVRRKEITIPDGGEAFIINACDGLTECESDYFQERIDLLREVIKANYQKPPHEFATELALAALHADISGEMPGVTVGDNISVMIMKVNPKAKQAIYMLVCDGHGGDEVSDLAAELYDVILENQILLEKLKDKDAKFVELVLGMLNSSRVDKDVPALKSLYHDFNNMLCNKLAKNP